MQSANAKRNIIIGRRQTRYCTKVDSYLSQFVLTLVDSFSSHLVNRLFVLRFYGPVNPMGSCRARFGQSYSFSLFVYVKALRPIQPNGVMSNAVSLSNDTFTVQAQSTTQ